MEFVSAYAREMAFGEERIGEIRLALEETLGNIIRFACPIGAEEIRITAEAHEMGAIVLNISDTGMPFNMLAMSAFPEMTGRQRRSDAVNKQDEEGDQGHRVQKGRRGEEEHPRLGDLEITASCTK